MMPTAPEPLVVSPWRLRVGRAMRALFFIVAFALLIWLTGNWRSYFDAFTHTRFSDLTIDSFEGYALRLAVVLGLWWLMVQWAFTSRGKRQYGEWVENWLSELILLGSLYVLVVFTNP